MTKLNKRYKRSIKENLSFYVSSTVLTIVTLFIFYMLNIAGNGIIQFGDEFFERNNVEDGEFSIYLPISQNEISELENEYDVQLEAQYYINLNEDGFTARIFSRTETINLCEITQGRDLSKDNEIIISEGYAIHMGIEIGDKITLKGNAYEVVGYFQRPDYLQMLESPDDGYKNIDSFFLAYVTDSQFSELGETPVQYFVKYNQDNQREFRRAVNERYIMQSYLSAEENPRISFVYEQANLFISCSYILLFILPFIAIAIICVIISRKVKSEQKMIGTLSALGYKKNKLMLHYTGFAVIPGLAGGILSYLLAAIFAQPYGEMGLSDYEPMRAVFSLSPIIGIIGIIIPTLMYAIAALAAVRRLLKNDTVTLLNGNAGGDKSSRRIFSKSRMSFKKKLAFRSLIGNPARSFVVFLGIFLGSFIMLFAFSIIDSAASISVEQAGSYEYLYVLNVLKTGEPTHGAAVVAANFESADGSTLPLYGTDNNEYMTFNDVNGNPIIIDDGYYVTNTTAYLLNLSGGDEIEIYSPLSMEKNRITISGIIDNDVQKGIFTSRQNAEALLGIEGGSYNALMSGGSLEVDGSEVSKTVRLSAVTDQIDTVLEEMGAIIYLLVAIGALICIAAIYVAVDMMMAESRSNISMLKVLGYNNKKINAIVLSPNHILLPIGIVLSIPVVYALGDLFYRTDTEMFGVIVKSFISVKSFILSILLTFASYFGSIAFIGRKIRRVSMVESLKDNRE